MSLGLVTAMQNPKTTVDLLLTSLALLVFVPGVVAEGPFDGCFYANVVFNAGEEFAIDAPGTHGAITIHFPGPGYEGGLGMGVWTIVLDFQSLDDCIQGILP